MKILKFIVKHWFAMWANLSWREVIGICLFIIVSMTLLKLYVVEYNIQCDDGSIVEIRPGTNHNVCDGYVHLNAFTGVVSYHRYLDLPKLNLTQIN